MFLTMLVSGPRNPKHKLDVFLQPLIAELKELWDVGILAYDISTKQNFQLRAALRWTINDFHGFQCCQGGAQLVDWHVCIVWVTQRHSHFQRVESNLGLTTTVSFYLQTTYFEGIDMLFVKIWW